MHHSLCVVVIGAVAASIGCGSPDSVAPPPSGSPQKPPARVASIAIASPAPAVIFGQSSQLSAITRDSSGNVLTGRVVSWSSTDSSIATVSQTGLVTGNKRGLVAIRAASEGDTAQLTIGVVIAASVTQTSVAAGYFATCAISDNTGTYCWGEGRTGSIGNAVLGNETRILRPSWVQSDVQFKAIFAGTSSPSAGAIVCGLTNIGQAYCWGPVYILAGGLTPAFATPTLMSPTLTFSTLAVGATHVCGVTPDHKLYCWGSNYYGEMMNGETNLSGTTFPTQGLVGYEVTSVAAGYGFTCATVTTGRTLCAGKDNYGQLGTVQGTATCSYFACIVTPTTVPGAMTFVSLTAGQEFVCGLTSTGAGYCWGHNDSGELGNGGPKVMNEFLPAPQAIIGGHTFTVLSAGAVGACGIASGGSAYCWGLNAGESNAGVPSPVSGAPQLSSISDGAYQTCGADSAGQLWCWGVNQFGELGDGTQNSRFTAGVVPYLTVAVP